MSTKNSSAPTRDFRHRIIKLANELLTRNGVEVYGELGIDVADYETLALIKGNTIYVSSRARAYPSFVLKYIIAHELGHLVVRRHTEKFWQVVRHIYPEYEKGRRELLRRTSQVLIAR